MKTTISKCGFSAFVLCLAVVAPSAVHAAGGTKTPKPLRTSEVVDMYFDKTWKWDTGGGRFIADGRKFIAATEEKGKKSIGEGRWTVDANGTLCMRATWKSAAGNGKADTCFDHGRIGKVLYQRKQGGPWYVFRHNPPRPGDEFLKLVRKDDVTPQIAAYDKAMTATR